MTTVRMMLVHPNGQIEFRHVPNTYPEFNNAVLDGGYMQELRAFAPDGSETVFLMDEEGKYKNLLPNVHATGMWYGMGGARLMPGDVFSGVVAICGSAGSELADVPEPTVLMIKTIAAGIGGMMWDEGGPSD